MLVDVALPLPVSRTYTYRAPDGCAPGTRVRVRFAGRRRVAWVMGPGDPDSTAADRILDVEAVLETSPSVPPDLLALCRWIADYYVTPIGLVLRAALPVALADERRQREPERLRRVVEIAAELPSLQQRDALFARTRRQRECYEALEAAGGRADARHLTGQLGFSTDILRRLTERALVRVVEEREARDPFAALPAGPSPDLVMTPAQRAAVAAITAAEAGTQPLLLLGVTGSGKTLVYLEALRRIVVEQGRGAIVLVPEIALTPQTVARFRAHFGDTIAVLHSALTDGERFDAWRALRDGERRIAIGARSAIFAPIRDLGAIIVDEEHESTYKQSESPRYHARDAAVMRARFAHAACVLGSATPSLESWNNVQAGKFGMIELPDRIGGRPLPPVRVIDLRQHRTDAKGERRSLSQPLVDAVSERLDRDEQVILLLNRRGYSTFVQCRSCGGVWHCPACNVSLTFHRARRRLLCHYCFHEEATPVTCDACGSADLAFRGVGTEQVEREVLETFAAARVARMDVDTTSARWSHHEILGRVERGEIDILLGTQMIAKGLDFPRVTLVGVINADIAMNLPDFRASERTFQLLTQVAGRAGRGERGGEVIVQSGLPGHYAIECARTHDFRAFAERELRERAGPGYPPHLRMANVVLSGTGERETQDAVARLADWVRALPESAGGAVSLTGPAPCPIDRIRGRWRWHFFLRAQAPGALGAACRSIQEGYRLRAGPAELRLILDRDPVTLL